MKVLLIQPIARGFDCELAKGLVVAGIEPVFVYTGTEVGVEKVQAVGVETRYLPLRSRLHLKGLLGVRKLVLETAPDVIYCGTAIQCFATIAAQWPNKRAKLIFYRGAIRRFNWLSPSDVLIFKSGWVDLFHCLSKAVADSLRRVGVSDTKIVTFPAVGYSERELDAVLSAERIANRSARFRLGTVANYRKVKGLEYAVDALKLLVDQGVDVELYHIGEDPQGKLRKYVAQSPAKSRVVLAGRISPAWGVMKTFDCLVVPSLSEGLGKVIIEAFGCGVPVVATNVGGIPELIKYGVNGLLVEPANASQLADAIRKVLLDVDLSAQFRVMGKKVFRERFEASVVVASYVDLLRKAVSAEEK